MSHVSKTMTIITCNRCGATGEEYVEGPFHNAAINGRYTSWGRSCNGDVGGATLDFDLCEACTQEFEKFMGSGKKRD